MARSGSVISAIFASTFASTSLSPSALFLFARASAFSSCARSRIAACSSSVNRLDALTLVVLADCRVPFFAGFLSATRAIRLPATAVA